MLLPLIFSFNFLLVAKTLAQENVVIGLENILQILETGQEIVREKRQNPIEENALGLELAGLENSTRPSLNSDLLLLKEAADESGDEDLLLLMLLANEKTENGTETTNTTVATTTTTTRSINRTRLTSPRRRRIHKKGWKATSKHKSATTQPWDILFKVESRRLDDSKVQQDLNDNSMINSSLLTVNAATMEYYLLSSHSITTSASSATTQTTTSIKQQQQRTTSSAMALCCPPGGLWSNWTAIGQCDDECGACGEQQFHRDCLSKAWNCDCIGESTARRPCALRPCPFPRLSCCNERRVQSAGNGQMICGTVPEPPVDLPPHKCPCSPPGGIWDKWKSQSECSDECGSCGTAHYSRQCISASWGCPCSGPVSVELECKQQPCTFPRLSCCRQLKIRAGTNRTLICGRESKLPLPENGFP